MSELRNTSTNPEDLGLGPKELRRLHTIKALENKQISVEEAAEILGISVRQVFRIKARFRKEGPKGLIHKNKGRKPPHTLPDEVRQLLVGLYLDKYHGSNYEHYSQLLEEHEGLKVSSSTVRRILQAAGIPPARKRRRRRKVHMPRDRKIGEGMLLQIDASTHNWLEEAENDGKMALVCAIDDATGEVVGATFRPTEDLYGYLEIMRQVIENKGTPAAVYSDRHTIFRSPNEKPSIEDQLAGKDESLSQFGQAMADLGIQHSKASSPQAKGRIERLWQTLQDRLVIELRLRGVKTIDEANAALPELIAKHNERFAKPAQDETASAYLPYKGSLSLNRVLCYRLGTRKVSSGQTISVNGQTYKLIASGSPEILPLRSLVDVRRQLDGCLFACYKGRTFNMIPVSVTQKVNKHAQDTIQTTKQSNKRRVPAPDHPWRSFRIGTKRQSV